MIKELMRVKKLVKITRSIRVTSPDITGSEFQELGEIAQRVEKPRARRLAETA